MKKLVLLLAIVSTAIVSCSKLTNSPGHHDRLMAILLGKDTLDMYVSETRQVPLILSPSNYGLDSLKWGSSDSTVISISSTGLLTAKKLGTSKISVSNLENTITVSCLVTVTPAPVDSLKIGLIAYYPFDNSAADSSGNGNNGTALGVTPAPDRFGNVNSAYYFNGDSTHYVTVKDKQALRLNNTDFTINVWVKLQSFNSTFGTTLVAKRYPGVNLGYSYSVSGYQNTVAPLGSIGFGPGGNSPGGTSTATIDTAQWYMLTVVYSLANTQVTFYKNGVFAGSSANNVLSPNANTNAALYIGKDDPQNNTNYDLVGSLDDVRIYNRALSVHEINKLYNLTN
jgi:hypothetical protein